MVEGYTEYFRQGGPTLVVLVLMSVLALAVGIERLHAMWRYRKRMALASDRVLQYLGEGNLTMARAVNSTIASHPGARLFDLVLGTGGATTGEIRRLERRIMRHAKVRMWILATIGATAPFVGLFGTVLGIMDAFQSISAEGSGGFQVVSAGISEALITTAAGIFVGVEAMVLFNILQSATGEFAAEVRDAAEEIAEATRKEPHVAASPSPG